MTSIEGISLDALKESGNLAVLEETNQILELQTILKDRSTEHSDFVFYADRLMRLVIEEGLNRLPFTEISITTPTHCTYKGIKFARGNCGLSLCRSGEAMEIALRQCCRSIRICKMLIGDEQKVLYARMTPDIANRRVLLLYPIISTGNTSSKAVMALKEAGVQEHNIYVITLFITPAGLKRIVSAYPKVTMITSEVSQAIPHNFAMKYFGTD
ncbi:unnamed protein product [Auanema sp. JU1783]|nr:unnamed protein product [Auanema sp. JU1783]